MLKGKVGRGRTSLASPLAPRPSSSLVLEESSSYFILELQHRKKAETPLPRLALAYYMVRLFGYHYRHSLIPV